MSEKKMQPSSSGTRRLLFYVVSLSIFPLFFACITLWTSNSNKQLISQSVLMLMLVNKTAVLSTNDVDSKQIPHLDSHTIPFSYLKSTNSSSKNRGDVKQNTKDGKVCDPNRAMLKIFMYDLPPEFHFGLLGWKGTRSQTWPEVNDSNRIPSYPGGLNLQHSMEYWLTLNLLASNYVVMSRPCNAIRVRDSSVADVIFVPFFSSLSYNRHSQIHGEEKVSTDRFLQDKLVKFLRNQEEWKRSGGRDHLIMAHHPNSLINVRRQLGSAILLLADFGRYPVEIANIKKDIIAPYKHVVKSIGKESVPFEARPILAYFQGAINRKDTILSHIVLFKYFKVYLTPLQVLQSIFNCVPVSIGGVIHELAIRTDNKENSKGGMIRQVLYQMLKDENDVHFRYGTVGGNGITRAGKGMASSRFCLNIAGDTPSSNRLFDAIVSHCVPVIISDEIELPFEDILDYSDFSIFVTASDAIREGFLLSLLRGIKAEEWTRMWRRLKEVAHHFEYQYPSKEGDAVEMIWQAVARKLSSARLNIHKVNRFYRSHTSTIKASQ